MNMMLKLVQGRSIGNRINRYAELVRYDIPVNLDEVLMQTVDDAKHFEADDKTYKNKALRAEQNCSGSIAAMDEALRSVNEALRDFGLYLNERR